MAGRSLGVEAKRAAGDGYRESSWVIESKCLVLTREPEPHYTNILQHNPTPQRGRTILYECAATRSVRGSDSKFDKFKFIIRPAAVPSPWAWRQPALRVVLSRLVPHKLRARLLARRL